jgi:hypothetical protein
MWHSELEIAIIEKDSQKIGELVNSLPDFKTVNEMKEAQYLLAEADDLLNDMREDAANTMRHLKKHIEFLKSTQEPSQNGFDMIS